MWDNYQKTVNKSVNFSGVGLHSGIKANVKLLSAAAGTGIIFKRVDLKRNNKILANFKNVSSAKLCTKIENSFGASVSTIEHLMAAFYLFGIDNLIVEIDGPEVPIMDGSSLNFIQILKEAGQRTLNKERKFIRITKKIAYQDKDKSISIEPEETIFKVKFTLSYNNPLIKNQSNKVNLNEDNLEDIYSARTFCLFEDVEKIKSQGFAKGGSLENAVVVKDDKVLNEGGLRSEKEFVNHKILDLLGDFMLVGNRMIGSVDCFHGGHSLTNDFLRKLFSKKLNYSYVESDNYPKIKKDTNNYQNRLVVNA